MMEKFKDFVITQTTLPAYLLDLLQTDEDILLVHCKKRMPKPDVILIDSMNMSSNSTMNLTGSPLEVDLNALPSAAAYHLSNDKNLDEGLHIPMKLATARKFLQEYQTHLKELPTNPKTIYCVCDGNDNKQIVALGSYQSGGDVIRSLCFLEDCVNESCIADNINNMMQKHKDNVGTNTVKIEVKVTCMYELYGFKLNNDYVFEDLENTGSILVEGCWNSCAYNIPQYGAVLKMMLQSIVGHEDSVMHPFFEELVFLQHCLTILSDKRNTLDDAIISSDPVDVADLNKRISDVLHAVNVIRKPSKAPTNLEDAIRNVEEMSLMDKLYDILKSCELVGDLRILFDWLFETVRDAPVRLQVYGNDKNTVVGKMIDDIASGKMIVTYLSCEQSLELLIELGIQRLKKNYFSIIKSFDFTIGEELMQTWNNVGSFLTESKRGTFAGHDSNQGYLQLKFLAHVHVSLEFLQLVEKNCCFSRDVSLSVMKHAYNKYVVKNTTVELTKKKQLCHLTIPLTFGDVKLIEDCSPTKWQLKMTSVQRNSSVTTIFHYSKKPIFPNTIYNIYDANESSDLLKENLFAARFESYSDKIFF